MTMQLIDAVLWLVLEIAMHEYAVLLWRGKL